MQRSSRIEASAQSRIASSARSIISFAGRPVVEQPSVVDWLRARAGLGQPASTTSTVPFICGWISQK